jgi:hypothetical protein
MLGMLFVHLHKFIPPLFLLGLQWNTEAVKQRAGHCLQMTLHSSVPDNYSGQADAKVSTGAWNSGDKLAGIAFKLSTFVVGSRVSNLLDNVKEVSKG